jgi:hypothetical protein
LRQPDTTTFWYDAVFREEFLLKDDPCDSDLMKGSVFGEGKRRLKLPLRLWGGVRRLLWP